MSFTKYDIYMYIKMKWVYEGLFMNELNTAGSECNF